MTEMEFNPAPPAPEPIRILFIEDDPDYRATVVAMLEDHSGPEVVIAYADRLAYGLLCLQREDFDVALVDLNLPDSTGIKSYERLREAAPDLPVIVLSGSYDEELAGLVLRRGAQDYLHKGQVTERTLGETVRHAIERHRFAIELERQRQEIARSELRIRRIFETSADAMIVVDGDGVVRFVNPAAATMFGRDAASLLGEPFGFPVATARATEVDIHRLGGGVGVAELRVVEIDWEQGAGYLATLHDVTARKQRDETLTLFYDLLDRSGEAIEIVDPETGRFLQVNEKACQDLGYSRDEMLALHIHDINPSVTAAGWRENVSAIRAAGTHGGESVHRRRDGTTFPIEFSSKLVHMDRDYLVTIVRDITDRVRAMERLREQALLLDRASDAIIVRELDETVRYWNMGAERIYGWKADEIRGRNVTKLLQTDPDVHDEAAAVLRKSGEWAGELQHQRKDGHAITVHSRWTLLRDDQGRPRAILSINTDITEQKKLEEQFLRSQRMECIGTLAGGIAHDLNNVLTPVLMAIGELKVDAADPARRRTLQLLESTTRRGAMLLQQMLAFGRGSAGERLPVQPVHIAQEVAAIIRDTFPRSITLKYRFPRDLGMVNGDPTQLHQILVNLCVNARDAMPNGGVLTLQLENTRLDATFAGMHPESRPGNYVVIRVGDTGIGMPPEVIGHIFEPFFTTKETGKGTGLGLSTVMNIARSHGGFVDVESTPGQGSTFRVYLPAIQMAELETPSATPPPSLPAGTNELVLMVDDEEPIRHVVSETLRRYGYRVLVAVNGAEAVSRFAQHQSEIAVVVIDMAMPVMDGPATIAALRTIRPDVRLIGMSGLTAAKAVDTDRFLSKPFVAEDLLRAVYEVIHAPGRRPDRGSRAAAAGGG